MKREKGSGDMFRIATVARVVIVMLILSTSSAVVVAASSTSVSIGSATVNVGESVTLPLMLENVTAEISCATVVLSYNNAVAQVTSASNGGFDALVYNADNAQGKTIVVVYQTGESDRTGTIKIADVTVKGAGSGSSPLNLEIATLKNNAGVPISAEVVNGSFTVKSYDRSSSGNGDSVTTPTPTPSPSPSPTPAPNVTGTPSPTPSPSPSQSEEPGIVTVRVDDIRVGEDVETTVTITINNVEGEGLSSARMTLTFDPKIVKVLSAESSEFDEFMSNIERGQVIMVGYQTGVEGLKGDVVFAEIPVKAVGKTNDRSELRLEVTELTDNVGQGLKENEDFSIVNGYFAILSEEEGAESEPSKPLIPTVGLIETLAVIIGAFFLITRTRTD